MSEKAAKVRFDTDSFVILVARLLLNVLSSAIPPNLKKGDLMNLENQLFVPSSAANILSSRRSKFFVAKFLGVLLIVLATAPIAAADNIFAERNRVFFIGGGNGLLGPGDPLPGPLGQTGVRYATWYGDNSSFLVFLPVSLSNDPNDDKYAIVDYNTGDMLVDDDNLGFIFINGSLATGTSLDSSAVWEIKKVANEKFKLRSSNERYFLGATVKASGQDPGTTSYQKAGNLTWTITDKTVKLPKKPAHQGTCIQPLTSCARPHDLVPKEFLIDSTVVPFFFVKDDRYSNYAEYVKHGDFYYLIKRYQRFVLPGGNFFKPNCYASTSIMHTVSVEQGFSKTSSTEMDAKIGFSLTMGVEAEEGIPGDSVKESFSATTSFELGMITSLADTETKKRTVTDTQEIPAKSAMGFFISQDSFVVDDADGAQVSSYKKYISSGDIVPVSFPPVSGAKGCLK